MASIYTLQGVPKILAHKALKQPYGVLKHTKDFPLLLYSIMLFYCLLQGASRRICLKRSLAIFKEFSENSLQILKKKSNFWRENSKSLQWAKYLFIILISPNDCSSLRLQYLKNHMRLLGNFQTL